MLAIGNGESRTHVNIDNLDYVKVGCNAILRDYAVDHLICVDKRMLDEALAANLAYTKIYTRSERVAYYNTTYSVPKLPYNGTKRPDDPIHWGSGPYAVLLAATLCNDRTVRLLGFDLHSTTHTVNNVYKGSNNYADVNSRAVDASYWVYQIAKVFECFPSTEFIIHQMDTWTLPQAWIKPNVMVDTISNL